MKDPARADLSRYEWYEEECRDMRESCVDVHHKGEPISARFYGPAREAKAKRFIDAEVAYHSRHEPVEIKPKPTSSGMECEWDEVIE